ncbi:MAG: FHA domain-containing protein [Vicinamibacterales bacterium]
MPTLRFSRAGAVETEVPLGAADLRVGRSADNDVILKDPEKTLSRHHAEIRRDGDEWVYLDLNSASGSWVGDRAVTREVLQPGLSIGLGDYQLTLVGAAVAGADDANLDATRVMRNLDDTLRPGAVAAPAPGRRSAAGVVGGAVPMGAPPPPPQPASSLVFRRIIIYGSIFVFGAFGVMLALILRPDPDAAVEEPAAVAAAETPAPPVAPEVPPAVAPEPAPPAAAAPGAPAAGQPAPSPAPVAAPAPPRRRRRHPRRPPARRLVRRRRRGPPRHRPRCAHDSRPQRRDAVCAPPAARRHPPPLPTRPAASDGAAVRRGARGAGGRVRRCAPVP